ncbi:MAG: type II toxin-antitoxin system death-on-curing family toxin [Candidatus Acidiferrales bacterium]
MLGSAYVEQIHDSLVMILWPGTDPVTDVEFRSAQMIESAVGRPFHSAFGVDAYPTIVDKSIALFHSLIANHPFWNGNKRTAVIAFDHFLVANGCFSAVSDAEMYELAEKTASYKLRGISQDASLAEIAEATRDRIVSLESLETVKPLDPDFGRLHEKLLKIEQLVRTHPANKIMD